MNLREMYPTYRLTWDQADESNHHDPAMMQIPGKWGTVYPHSQSHLAVEINGHNKVARVVGRIPGVTLNQGGSDEFTYLFTPDLFDKIAETVRSYRKGGILNPTEEQKEIMLKGLRGEK